MHLLIDVQGMQSPDTRNRGIGRYSRNLVAALAAARPGWRIELVQSAHLEPIPRTRLPDLPIHDFTPALPFHRHSPEANENYYGDWLTAARPDAILILSFFSDYAVVPQFTGIRPRLFGILYDLIPLLFPNPYLLDPMDLADYGRRFRRMANADCLLAISESSRQDLHSVLPKQSPRVITIGGAPDPSFVPFAPTELQRNRTRLAERFELRRDFILCITGSNYRKNLEATLQAFVALPYQMRRSLDLAMVGDLAPRDAERLRHLAGQLGIGDSLRLLGFVTDGELRALYQICRVFFLPSLYEGLGLPVLEALGCGAPVVCSNGSSLPEVAGTVSCLADPSSPTQLARALAAALSESRGKRLEERLEQARRFRWERIAELAACAMHTPLARTRRPIRRRIAWASPLPPNPTGVADYSCELLGPLAERYDIELIVDAEQKPVTSELARRHVIVCGREVAARHQACPYDLFMYHVGNSPLHLYICELMQRFRGLVVLHDYHVGELVLRASADLASDGDADLIARYRAGQITRQQLVDQAPLNQTVLTAADALIVHSNWTWQRVRGTVRVPLAHIPQHALIPHLRSRPEERARLGFPADAFLIATLGYVGRPKRIPTLFQVVAELPTALQQKTRVAVVGGVEETDLAELQALAQKLGLASQVQFTGRVPLEDLAAYARAADVCVQLRYPTRGETSAALLRALSSGTPCIISDHGSIADVPENAALRVRTPDQEAGDLRAALLRLHENPALGGTLGEAAVRFLREQHSIENAVLKYVAMIELAALDRRERDALWTERVCESLARWPDSAVSLDLIDSWADLRYQGQQAMRTRRRRDRRTDARGSRLPVADLPQ